MQHRNCYANKVGSRLPIVFFRAWIDWGDPTSTRKLHCDQKALLLGVVPFSIRNDARQRALLDPEWIPVFEWEVPAHQGEPQNMLG